MMKSPIVIAAVAGLATLAVATTVSAAQTVRAGAWETKMGDYPPRRICQTVDRTFDQATISKMMAAAGVHCVTSEIRFAGPSTAFSSTCEIGGGKLTTLSTLTQIGPDVYSTHSTSHYAGGSIKMPDQDLTMVTRRVGECAPGDRRSPW